MTRIAYIISAYKLPEQLGRLVRRLRQPGATFTIHVDRKTSGEVFAAMRAGAVGDDVTFVSRHLCHWGGFGHVEATLKGIRRLYDDAVPFDYVVLLTGQDYPLRAPSEIATFLGDSGGRSYMNHWRLPFAPWGARGGLDRIEDWHFVTFNRSHIALPLRRNVPTNPPVYGGGAYWCLARPVVDLIQTYLTQNPEYVRFFRRVLIPDELFFQTIVCNSTLADTVVNDNLRFLDWSREPAPAILGVDDLPAMLGSGKLFARKFDSSVDEAVLDAIDLSLGGAAR